MLMEDSIRKNKYFQAIRMKENNLLDPLTGTIARAHLIRYIKYLIKSRRIFTVGIIDIDNFKNINDTFGHQGGDVILQEVSKSIMSCFEDNVIVGRYGGDEFMFIIEGSGDYDTTYEYCTTLYRDGLRKKFELPNGKHIFVTATTGCSSFPTDASNYDDLFTNCDKCLYRGKLKGRNCFIVYVESLHKNINIAEIKKRSFATRVGQLFEIYDQNVKGKVITRSMTYVANDNQLTGIAHIMKGKVRNSYIKNDIYGECPVFPEKFLKRLEYKPWFKVDDYTSLKDSEPDFYEFCYENNLLSFVVHKVNATGKDLGYIVFYDSDFVRIWQDDAEAMFTIYAKTFSFYL